MPPINRVSCALAFYTFICSSLKTVKLQIPSIKTIVCIWTCRYVYIKKIADSAFGFPNVSLLTFGFSRTFSSWYPGTLKRTVNRVHSISSESIHSTDRNRLTTENCAWQRICRLHLPELGSQRASALAAVQSLYWLAWRHTQALGGLHVGVHGDVRRRSAGSTLGLLPIDLYPHPSCSLGHAKGAHPTPPFRWEPERGRELWRAGQMCDGPQAHSKVRRACSCRWGNLPLCFPQILRDY